MAATTAGALKALIEAGGLSLAAYRDDAPKDAVLPYVIVHEGIALVPSPTDSRFDRAGGRPSGEETVQVSLWQQWRDSGGVMVESYTLPDALAELLDGAVLTASPKHTWGVRFISSRRLPERSSNLVQHAMTVEVVRDF
jgi:hypothetical protein